ncbi:hypothetical protein FRB91_004894 [Serendipita sp. 411]|nr:hypothetical protein FRB91_004894 [Serendipita sp. 411]KAG8845242.1 hypothetical protein FRC20_003267 [Serendipita sp. 405]
MSIPTTIDPPPAYNEAENAVLDSFFTPEAQVRFKLQIDNITTHTRMLAERFRAVKERFENIDKHELDEPLVPTWIGFRDVCGWSLSQL